jgi:hypothetical protein
MLQQTERQHIGLDKGAGSVPVEEEKKQSLVAVLPHAGKQAACLLADVLECRHAQQRRTVI